MSSNSCSRSVRAIMSVLVSRDREGLSICVNFDGGYRVDTYD